MINVLSSITIYCPVQKAFEFISSSENDFQWQYGTLASVQVSEGAARVGTFFRSIGHLLGRRILGTFEVTEYEPNKKYGFKSLSGPLRSNTLYTFEMANGCTKVKVFTQASVVNLFQTHEGLVEKQMKKQLKDNLVMLKGILETG